ncbi:hypothetical protein HELRODRAFT_185068 [Helobdella robusta]|uniref:alkaline phosphatase n=1 Tax=Helobdella robusta TaxID=6412 RepID=T1FMC8_HELRO|nr:hypothetical protein HELRODRAFT_185068 [Helobdella robusta]ESN96159.1 hypothetical protein HELRODRAFT_185068 [Helobdella robusta]
MDRFKELILYSFLACLLSFNRQHGIYGETSDDHEHHHPHLEPPPDDHQPPYHQPWAGNDWAKLGRQRIEKISKTADNLKRNKAKNVILFLGDGMGLSTIAAARVYRAQREGLKHEKTYLTMETLPYAGLSRTYSVDRTTADSASTATAYLCGVKTNYGTLGVNEYVSLGSCDNYTDANRLKSSAVNSIDANKWVGVISTTRLTHASPAGNYANSPDRNWEGKVDSKCRDKVLDIAQQLVVGEKNRKIRVAMGGGVEMFIPKNESEHGHRGKRDDNRNLIKEWMGIREANKERYKFVKNKKEFDAANPANVDYLLGLFSYDHMSYEADRNRTEQPSLAEMTKKSLQLLSRSPNGYFLFVEGGRIDHAHHDTNAQRALIDTLSFDEAIRVALNMTNDNETLVVVTADHSHTLTLGGYGLSTESILGFSYSRGKDGKPFLQLHYANGPGFEDHRMVNGKEVPRKNLTGNPDLENIDFRQDTGIWLSDETHGGEDVAVYASGPWAHLFGSSEEETHIAHSTMFASCVGQYSKEKHCGARTRRG